MLVGLRDDGKGMNSIVATHMYQCIPQAKDEEKSATFRSVCPKPDPWD